MDKGRRVYKLPYKLEPGAYTEYNDCWYGRTPNGYLCNLSSHEVTEHDDGTITVSPSIRVTDTKQQEQWHGYLEHGVWREV